MQTKMLDITAPTNLEVTVSSDAKRLWINVDGICVFRACKIAHLSLDLSTAHTTIDVRPRYPYHPPKTSDKPIA